MQPEPQQEMTMNDNPTKVKVIGYQDFFLETLVELVNDGGLSFSITLVVGGFLISGMLIPGDEYYETIGREFGQAAAKGDEGTAKKIQESFSSLGQHYKDDRENPDAERQSPSYIHLKDCKLGSVSSQSNFGSIWRGRISEVSGFFMGSFTPAK
jgi:hypothetical protein